MFFLEQIVLGHTRFMKNTTDTVFPFTNSPCLETCIFLLNKDKNNYFKYMTVSFIFCNGCPTSFGEYW